MKNNFSKLRQTQKQEAISEQREKSSGAKEFSSVEELLRHDAGEIAVPAAVAVKLNESIQQAPPPDAKHWWQRFFSRESS